MKCRTSTPIEVEVQPGAGGVQMLRQLADAIETTLAGDQDDTDEDLPPVVELPFVPRRLDLPTLEALADALDSVEADDEAPAVEQPSVPERLGPPTPEELIEALDLVNRTGPMPVFKFRRLDYRPRRPVWLLGEVTDFVTDDDDHVRLRLARHGGDPITVDVRGVMPAWIGEGELVEVIGRWKRDGALLASAVLPVPRPTWALP